MLSKSTIEILNSLVDATLIVNENSRVVFANKAFLLLFGYKPHEIKTLELSDLMPTKSNDNYYVKGFIENENLGEKMMSRQTTTCLNSSGHGFSAQISLAKIELNNKPHILATIFDFSAIKKLIEDLKKLSETDPLTQVFNKRYLDYLLKESTYFSTNSNYIGVAYLDLNDFKKINDTYGHDVGDELLISLGNRLKKFLRQNDICVRVGGDEFLVLFPIDNEIRIKEKLEAVGKKLQELITHEVPIKKIGKLIKTRVSIGLSCYPYDGDINETISKADKAMYRAKTENQPYALS